MTVVQLGRIDYLTSTGIWPEFKRSVAIYNSDSMKLTIIAAHAIAPGVMPVPKIFQRYLSILRDLRV